MSRRFDFRDARLLLLDVDGVLTDGRIIYSDSGEELKAFHVQDGSALKLWQQTGRSVAILSGRSSAAVSRRAAELNIRIVLQGISDKLAGLAEIEAASGIERGKMVAMGDDLADLPVFAAVGFAISLADACDEARQWADWVTTRPGGHAAVREAIRWMLCQTGEWPELI